MIRHRLQCENKRLQNKKTPPRRRVIFSAGDEQISMNGKKQSSDKGKTCPYYDKCPVRLHPLSAMDSPNMAAHLGFRFLYTLIAWFVLGFKVNEGFFVSMFFFVLPVFMDCVKFTPLIKLRRWIKYVEVVLTGMALFFSLLGVFGIYTLKNETGTWQITYENFAIELPSGFDVGWIWIFLISIVFVTAVDWFCNDTKFDRVNDVE